MSVRKREGERSDAKAEQQRRGCENERTLHMAKDLLSLAVGHQPRGRWLEICLQPAFAGRQKGGRSHACMHLLCFARVSPSLLSSLTQQTASIADKDISLCSRNHHRSPAGQHYPTKHPSVPFSTSTETRAFLKKTLQGTIITLLTSVHARSKDLLIRPFYIHTLTHIHITTHNV